MPDAHAQASWTPPATLCDHAGQRIRPQMLFAWPPPAEIGDVISAHSNIEQGKEPSFIKPWIIVVALMVGVYVGMGEIMPRVIEGKGDPNIVRMIAVGVGLLAGFASLLWTWPSPPQCTYVGQHGLTTLTGRWGKSHTPQSQVVRFDDVTALYVSVVHMHKNLMYQNTLFNFAWFADPHGKAAFDIAGEHNYKDAPPPVDNIYHYALMAECVWSEQLVSTLGPGATADKPLVFPCRDGKIKELRLYPDRIEFAYADRVESLALSELGHMDAKRGVVRFDQHDASWFSNQGKFRINYRDIGNAQVFLHYLGKTLDER